MKSTMVLEAWKITVFLSQKEPYSIKAKVWNDEMQKGSTAILMCKQQKEKKKKKKKRAANIITNRERTFTGEICHREDTNYDQNFWLKERKTKQYSPIQEISAFMRIDHKIRKKIMEEMVWQGGDKAELA